MDLHYIVMADVIRSRSFDGATLLPEFSRIVEECNAACRKDLVSPYTITLGDEFQGVAGSLRSAVDSILFLEDLLLTAQPAFMLRYVVVYGGIETSVNPHIAHGMTGPGLATAREMLTRKRRGRRRFELSLPGFVYAEEMNMLFRLLELLSAQWKEKDYLLIRKLIHSFDDAAVAAAIGKTPSQVWKRRKTLQIEEYVTVRNLICRGVSQMEEAR